MSQTFEEYCRDLEMEVNAIEQQAEADVRFDHLRAFNFGRSLGRVEQSSKHAWLCVRWLLLGAAIGVAVVAVYLEVFLSGRILQIIR